MVLSASWLCGEHPGAGLARQRDDRLGSAAPTLDVDRPADDPVVRRRRYRHHAACTSVQRTAFGPALVMPVRCVLKPVVFSPGVSPKYEATSSPLGNRLGSSIAATNLTAVIGPTPGIVISSLQIGCC
jgi:hypothetical protein